MAKNKTAAGTNRGKKSVAVRVFDIIFIVLAVLLVIAALIIFTPRNKILVKLPQEFTSSLYTWTKWHVLKPFSRGIKQGPKGRTPEAYSGIYYLFIVCFCATLLFYLRYQPFVVLASNKAKGKNETYRKVLCWVTFAIILIASLALASLIYQYRCEKIFGAAYSWWPDFFNHIARSLHAGKLSLLNRSAIAPNGCFNAFAYAGFARILFEIIRLVIAGAGKAKAVKPAEEPKAEEIKAEETEEVKTEEVPAEAKPVRVEEKAPEFKPHEIRYPTVRDLELLASLEPIHVSR